MQLRHHYLHVYGLPADFHICLQHLDESDELATLIHSLHNLQYSFFTSFLL
jgi:hypothetical protein